MNKEILFSILKGIDYSYEDVAKAKFGKSREISVGKLVETIYEEGTGKRAATKLDIGEQTFNRMVRRLFPNTYLTGSNNTWKTWLLLQSEYKKCSKCSSLKSKEEFYNSTERKHLDGKHHRCIKCSRASFESWRQKNKAKHSAMVMLRHEKYKKATPSWFEKEEILLFYSNRPEGYHVDHIIPIQGALVSGLHVLNNLQYLPASENIAKSNKYEIQ